MGKQGPCKQGPPKGFLHRAPRAGPLEWLDPPVGVAGAVMDLGRCHPPEAATAQEAADLEAQKEWERVMEPGGHDG